ncbi:MAG: hypothetical protein JWO95_3091 [Verrucomicrobiales bacterium]|nr:hypothetical protein [Verrucomicrobiales bacterium]
MVGLLLAQLVCGLVEAQPRTVLDNGIDAANLGRGDWIYKLDKATNQLNGLVPQVTNIASLMAYEKSHGIDFIVVKAGTGATNYPPDGTPQFSIELVEKAHDAGLKIFGYTRSYGSDIPGETVLVASVYDKGADGFIVDAEGEWQSNHPWIGTNGPALAVKLLSGIKARFPTKFLGHSPFPIIEYHRSFPYKEFGLYCDAAMPQIYWEKWPDLGIHSPQQGIDRTDREWKRWHASLQGEDRKAIKPIAPVAWALASCTDNKHGVTGADIKKFARYLRTDANAATIGGYKGISFYALGAGEDCVRTPDIWRGIAEANVEFVRPTAK